MKQNVNRPNGLEEKGADSQRPFSLAVFDLDGTLVDSLRGLADSCNEALTALGFVTHPRESYRLFVGDGLYELCRRALPQGCLNDKTVADLKAAFDTSYQKRYLTDSHPYEGILAALKALLERGVLLGVFSNKPDEFASEMVSTLFPGLFFAAAGNRADTPKKPDPAVLLAMMERAGATPENTVYFGDSGVDMSTGTNAGVYTVGCAWGFRGEEELLAAGAQRILHAPNEILTVFENTP